MVGFVVNGKAYTAASSKLGRVVKSDDLHIKVKSGILLLHCAGEMQLATTVVPCEGKTKGTFTISKGTLDSIIRGGDDWSISVKDNMLSFKNLKTGYNGSNIPTMPTPDLKIVEPSLEKSTWGKQLQQSVVDMLTAASIQSFIEEDQLPIYISKQGETLYVASADQFHVVLSELKVPKKMDFTSLVVPSSYAAIIASFSDEPFSVSVTDWAISIQTETFYCELPSLQIAQIIPLSDILKVLEGKTKPTFSCNLHSGAMQGAVSNLQVVYEVGTGTRLVYDEKKKRLVVSLSTMYGKTEDRVVVDEVKGKCDFVLNTENLEDILSKMSGQVTLNWIEGLGAKFSKVEAGIKTVYLVAAFTDRASEQIKSKKSSAGANE